MLKKIKVENMLIWAIANKKTLVLKDFPLYFILNMTY